MSDGRVHFKICEETLNWYKDGTSQLKWHLNSKHELNSAPEQTARKDNELESEEEFVGEIQSSFENVSNKTKKIEANLVKFIIGTNSSISLVSNSHIQNFVKSLNNEYCFQTTCFE